MERQRKKEIEQVATQVREHKDLPPPEKERVEFISTGSILLNLAASQKGRGGGWARGRIINPVGDSSSGKTLLALEAAVDLYYNIKKIKSKIFPKVKETKIVYWNRERVMDFPLEKMYGEEFVEHVDWSDKCSNVEEWGRDVFRHLDKHKPGECFLGILDSIDSLTTEGGTARLNKSIKTDKPLDGSYGSGAERAKYFSSEFFNGLCDRMENKDFTLMLISQVRDKINAGMFEKKQYRAGGKALGFYSHQVPWLSSGKKLKKSYDGEERVYAVTVNAMFEKNKTALPFRRAQFDILFDYGLDDIGSMVKFLSSDLIQKVFKEQFDKQVSRDMLIEAADNDANIYDKLVETVENYWREIEDNTTVKRNPRFP